LYLLHTGMKAGVSIARGIVKARGGGGEQRVLSEASFPLFTGFECVTRVKLTEPSYHARHSHNHIQYMLLSD